MSKKEKKSQSANKNKFAEKNISDSSDQKFDPLNQETKPEKIAGEEKRNSDFIEKLETVVEGLWYMSETDAEIKVFTGKAADSVSRDVLAGQSGIPPETDIEEKDFAEFFRNLTRMQDWFGEEEKATAEKFSALEKLLEENLTDLKVFKVGQIELDIYVVGLDKNSVLTGIKTRAVET